VFVGGTTVTRATLANQEVIRARGIKIGDTVLVRRAGDVIPFVAGVLDESKRTGQERDIVPPTHCPSCGEPLTEQGNSRELFCTNVACPAQTVRRLIHWASRAAADIEAVGPVWIERLAEAKLLEHPSDFYALTKEQLLEFERIGEVSAERMVESIEASKDVGLRRALIGLAIPMASEGTAKRLCLAGYERIEDVAAATAEDLVAIRDIGPKAAESIVAFFARADVQEEIAALRERGVNLDVLPEDRPVDVAAAGGSPLKGRSVVITGAFTDPRSGAKISRPDVTRLVEQAAATTASSVSASTDYLLAGDNAGASKTGKAEKLGVTVVHQDELWGWLAEAGVI
jgi:DNA ligase (NAD+)